MTFSVGQVVSLAADMRVCLPTGKSYKKGTEATLVSGEIPLLEYWNTATISVAKAVMFQIRIGSDTYLVSESLIERRPPKDTNRIAIEEACERLRRYAEIEVVKELAVEGNIDTLKQEQRGLLIQGKLEGWCRDACKASAGV